MFIFSLLQYLGYIAGKTGFSAFPKKSRQFTVDKETEQRVMVIYVVNRDCMKKAISRCLLPGFEFKLVFLLDWLPQQLQLFNPWWWKRKKKKRDRFMPFHEHQCESERSRPEPILKSVQRFLFLVNLPAHSLHASVTFTL